MNKDEVIKELEELRDIKEYSQSKLINTGYRTAILDALDLVKKLTIPVVVKSFTCDVCFNETENKKDKENYRYCNSCKKL